MTKLHGEQKIIATGCNHVIIRIAWLYSAFGKNFCKTMMNLTATKPELKVVFDQVGTPTYALDLAKAITAVLNDYTSSVIPGLTGNLMARPEFITIPTKVPVAGSTSPR